MARIDKVTQIVRAPAGTALTGLTPVTLNAGGSVIPSGTSNCIGIVCLPGTIAAGGIVGVLTRGEIVEASGLSAGSIYYGGPSGTLTTTSTSAVKLGFTVEATRLVVSI